MPSKKRKTKDAEANTELGITWTSLGAVLAYFSFDAWVATQKGKIGILEYLDYDGYAAALFGIAIGALMLWLHTYVGWLALRHSPQRTWPANLPVPLKSDPNGMVGKRFRWGLLIALSFFPFCAQIHFLRKFWDGCFHLGADCMSPTNPGVLVSSKYWYHSVQFFPFYEPLFLTGLSAGAMAYTAHYWSRLLWPGGRRKAN